MNQNRLCDLALSLERDDSEKTDFDEIIDEFASINAQSVVLSRMLFCLNKKRPDMLMFCLFITIRVLH